ncbi:MAG: hypothetical protein ACRDRL_17345 [Sciscionella sp.]
MNENPPAPRQRINDKLNPCAHLFLAVFKTYGQTITKGTEGLSTASATMVTDFLRAIDCLNQPGMTFGYKTNKQIAAALNLPEIASNPKQMAGLIEGMYKTASAKEKVLADAVGISSKSPRANRDPKSHFKKAAHGMIFEILIFFGSLPGIDSEFSHGTLDNEELKAVFDSYCGACPKAHKIETVKKLKTRFLHNLLAHASKYKGERVTGIRILAPDSQRSNASRRSPAHNR